MMINTFWIAANIIYDLNTGKKSDVLMLVNEERHATYFKKEDAPHYLDFVKTRSPEIQWFIDPTNQRAGMFVIRGVQNV
jgi:hypothetical protein